MHSTEVSYLDQMSFIEPEVTCSMPSLFCVVNGDKYTTTLWYIRLSWKYSVLFITM